LTGGEKSEIYDPGRGDVVDTVPLASEDDMMAGMVAATEAYNVGDKLDEATDMGPLINEAAAENVERMDGMPFGGVKGTGLGREGIEFAIHEMTEPKVVCHTRPG